MMVQARREYQKAAELKEQEMTASQMIAAVKAILVDAAGAEYGAATCWKVLEGEHGSRWGRRQARTERAWERRWRGLAQVCRARVVWHDHADFDRSAALRTLEYYQTQTDRLNQNMVDDGRD